ncbi:WD repeat and FYVE domain-containing protein 3-like isoform X2 [Littorina saxatilis]|uniref:WD repeat and FYVE domain-containing protein 3-like isoform X2 n=1 Tax=Littorina saxatilis TaxID=31220 RepID=UPI0038B48080
MSLMRKMLSRGGQSEESHQGQGASADTTLGLMHLRKLFAEFRHPTTKVSQKDQEDKLYNMLPLFCKVFENAPSSDMTEKWGDILQFCSHVSKLMVTEIRRRASNQSTEAASRAIVELLEVESGVDNGNGWLLLGTINLLSLGGQALIDCMTAASLPSTLVKCLYLLFDLPPVEDGEILAPGCQFKPNERRILLQKVFVQVLVRLCNYVSPAEELARKDDLSLLFSAITSWCVPHNVPWRQSAGEVLVTLSRHGLAPSVVKYIHDKGCVRRCVENMQRAQDLSPLEMVEMFVTVFCFLKDSSEVSQTLLDDFKACQGYNYLADFLLRLEKEESEESVQALRNLVLLVGSLTTCGFTELLPTTSNSGSLFHLPGFVVPQPTGKGVSVRNIQAFHVLQSVFIKAETAQLCSTILDVLSSIYHQDPANYFILESQNTLSQFAEKIFLKQLEIQNKFFELLDFVVTNLNFVPCKELISLSILVKTQHSLTNTILCMKTLLRILRYHSVYRDVFREVGILEVMVTCLHRYAAHLKEIHTPSPDSENKLELSEDQQELGHLVMEALSVLLTGNNANASVFHQCGGARCAHNMVPYPECRQQALNIVQQLVLSPGGDDDMGTLLGLMPTANITDLELKTHILKSLLNVLRESHRTRTVFRKVGGFVYVMSVLVSMEGSLDDPPKSPWNKVGRRDVLMMLHTVFSTLTVAMRYEPANAKFFTTEVRYDSLTEAVRLLGCFSGTVDIPAHLDFFTPEPDSDLHEAFADLFSHTKEEKLKCSLPAKLASACTMLRYLYDMSLDAFDRPSHLRTDSPCLRKHMSEEGGAGGDKASQRPKRSSTGSMGLSLNGQPDPVVVHAGAVLSIFHLLPAIDHADRRVAMELQLFTASMLKTLLRPERNQQILCDSGMPHELLSHTSAALTDETHSLHPPLQHMFERLASQSLTPRDLRDFLRLGSPLSCRSVEEEYQDQSSLPWHDPDIITWSVGMEEKQATMETERKLQSAGRPVPLTRVKCLVSMTTPRDARMHGASVTPAFVEFDMAAEGFACLYLPSIAPQGPPTPSVVGGVVGTSEPAVIGGIGTGERVFPPQSGLTLSTWFCVDKFSSAGTDGHPVRLLTVVRNIQGREENLICLSVFLTSRDRALIVTTQESYMPVSGNGCEFEQDPGLSDNTVRFWCPELTQEGQWHHLMLIFHRAGIMKNSSVSLFVDGDHMETQKLHYISPNLGGGGTASPSAFTSVFAYIGSPPQLRRQSRLSWRQGPLYLLEDIVASAVVTSIYRLGPTYVGSLQAPLSEENELCGPFITEEKVMLAVHAHAMCQLTVAKVRKVYNKVDSKSIAKQLAMSAHENATPIRILHNAAGHLAGPARSLGAVLMGYLGVRTFCPKPVARMLENVGGTSCLLGLIAMATDVEGLYAAVKALVCVVRSNHASMWDMDRIRGYQLLAMLYKKKTNLLNSHILHLTFSLVGSLDSGRESAVIPNKVAFDDLLCDLEVWHKAPGDLQRSLYEHFYELLTDSSEAKTNCELMRDMGLVNKLLNILRDVQLSVSTTNTIASVICELFTGAPDSYGLLRLGHYLVSTLPPVTFAERSLDLQKETSPEQNNSDNGATRHEGMFGRQFSAQQSLSGDNPTTQLHNVRVRNILLEVVLKLVLPPGSQSLNQTMCEELQKVLGFDWLLLFLQGHLHPTTVRLALHILVVMLRNPEYARRFREGTHRGGWLADTENVLKNQMAVMLGFNVGAGAKESAHEVNVEVCSVPGFQVLQWLLPRHTHIPAVFFLLMKMLLGQHNRELPDDVQLSLDAVWTVIFGVPASKPVVVPSREQVDLCPDAAMVILAMVRSMLNQLPADNCIGSTSPSKSGSPSGGGEAEEDHPMTLIQFLMYLYHNVGDFRTLCMSGEFITALVATLFPYPMPDYSSDVTTPNEEFKPFPDSEPIVMIKSQDKDVFSHLTTHPAKRFIIDFLRTIVIDSFSQQTTKLGAVLDVMLEAVPDHASRAQQREFQTTMLSVLMEHLLAADVLLGEQAALPLISTNTYATMAHSVFYFASRVVDKLWHGVYIRDSKEVFDFISKLISQSKRKSSGLSLDSIYKCLNRTILFQLSRPVDTVAGQASVLDTLHTLTNNRGLVFGPSNYDHEFLGCLCFCLLHLTDDPDMRGNSLNERLPRMTTWHVESVSVDLSLVGDNGGPGAHVTHPINLASIGAENLQAEALTPSLKEGLKLVSKAAQRVWDELYIHKKPTLEDIFKTQLNNITSATKNITTPEINAVRPLIQETASKMWVTYAENERKSSFLQTEKLQNQIQSKLQRMGSGVLRLASRKPKRDLPIKASPVSNVHMSDFMMWTSCHVDLVKEVVAFQYDQFMQSHKHMERYLLEEWQSVEKELLRERSLWGPTAGSRLQRWMLDMTEGPGRMRKKMTKNEMFYIHYPYRPDLEDNPLRYKVAISFDSKEYYENFRPQGILCHEAAPIQHTSDVDLLSSDADQTPSSPEDIINMRKLLPRSTSNKSAGDEEEGEDSSMLDGGAQSGEGSGAEAAGEGNSENPGDMQQEEPAPPSSKSDNQTIMRILGDKEKISHMFRCARIQGLDTAEGLLLFGREHFYIIDGFTLLRTKEIKDIDSLPYEIHDPIIPKSSMGSVGPVKRLFSKFAYDDIREVHKRRYLLQPIAIEVFSGDGRNHLLAFPRKIRNKVFAKFLSVATAITDNAQTSVSGQRQNAKVESGGGLISSLIGEKSVTQRWERGEINNFQYLMHLNTLAGRSYNDLMQYPVFPWIIADYDSPELDFSQPSTFRDLTKPMGAQTPDRLKQFQKRYNEWDDPQGETPPYHYGTHYSSAMIVASYLVRMEPFTSHFLKLQGGHFDLADRMFHSVRENWMSASKHNMADIKELIPEFFYLPDFLLNKNNFDLGCKQSGTQLDDVILPPWAKGDPREFIRLHRQALESDYVSAHLHEWIDLIFGYKQRGPPAVEALNVFHYLFYEGNVDIYSIQDPLKKNATIGFINNFGQIAKQLFKKPHPPKRLSARLLETLPMSAATGIAADQRLFFHHVDNLKPSMQPIKELKTAVGHIIHTDRYVLAVEQNKVLIPSSYGRYLAWGFADLSLRLGFYESEKAIAIFEGLDNGEILCASCPHDKMFVTGGTSCVVRVWEYSAKDRRACLKQPLYGHTEPVTCLTTSPAYNVIVTGSRDRTCIIWDMCRLIYVHQLRGHVAPVAAVCVNELTGDIATCAGTYLHLWTINGEAIASINTATGRNQQILCVAMSQFMEWDAQNVILTGSSDGVVRMWSVEYVQVAEEKETPAASVFESGTTNQSDNKAPSASSSTTTQSLLKRRLSRHESCDSYASEERSAVEHLKDFKDPEFLAVRESELGSSGEQDSPLSQRMKIQEAAEREGRGGVSEYRSGNISTTSSLSDLCGAEDPTWETGSVKSNTASVDTGMDALAVLGEGSPAELESRNKGGNKQGSSQSEPCLSGVSNQSDGGDVRSLSHNGVQAAESAGASAEKSSLGSSGSEHTASSGVVTVPSTKFAEDITAKYRPLGKNTLREGFRWQRQLMFRSKLTMHTAFERKDNKEPAAVTAIAISRDHKTVYVGDGRGRIFNWTVTDQPGRVAADHWMKDEGVESCPVCNVRFNFAERRHHCRNCGKVFCSKCSHYETEIRRLRILKPVRVCQSCYNILRAQQAADALAQAGGRG